MADPTISSRLPGLAKLSCTQRLNALVEAGFLTESQATHLQAATAPQLVTIAESLIENVIGCYALPLGVATNFCIDGQDRLIPLAVEETSIIAALCRTAKWVREHGSITTTVLGEQVIGQIQIAQPRDLGRLRQALQAHKAEWIALANREVVAGLVKRGGGVRDIVWREVSRGDQGVMVVLHVLLDACDAMGANLVNQVCEALKPLIEQASDERVTMCIVSNLVDSRCVQAQVRLEGIEEGVMARIAEASLFAKQDPYRAATSNKGVLNGIDALMIATGNDWRAIEAGIHAYAARDGQYRSITDWSIEAGVLVGTLTAPLAVGTVGGVTRLHPTATLSLQLLGTTTANELARVAVAVGLVQNLAAVRALVTDGIVQGHMRLHINNLMLDAGANEAEAVSLRAQLEELLAYTQKITLSDVSEALTQLRQQAHG